MKLELEISDSDFKLIRDAKKKGTNIGKLELGIIGDIVLSNIKNKNGK